MKKMRLPRGPVGRRKCTPSTSRPLAISASSVRLLNGIRCVNCSMERYSSVMLPLFFLLIVFLFSFQNYLWNFVLPKAPLCVTKIPHHYRNKGYYHAEQTGGTSSFGACRVS